MKVVITGGTGFLGQYLAAEVLRKFPDVTQLVLIDLPTNNQSSLTDKRMQFIGGDISNYEFVLTQLKDAGLIFHLAGVVSGAAEADFNLGMKANLHGTMNILEAARANQKKPKLIFSSSLAVYGGVLAEKEISDLTPLTPISSYGAQKAASEFLVTDYSRKGFIDGRSVRLPAVVVRPGKANQAASGFISSIIRDCLNGEDVVCPVDETSSLPCLSPKRSIEALIKASEIDAKLLGESRSILLSSIQISAGEAYQAVKRYAKGRKIGNVSWQVNPVLQGMINKSPKKVHSQKAESLGFYPNTSLDEIMEEYISTELSK